MQLAPGAVSSEVKRPRRETDPTSPNIMPSSGLVELYIHSPPYVLTAWCLINHAGGTNMSMDIVTFYGRD
jgi:hypothetical protein